MFTFDREAQGVAVGLARSALRRGRSERQTIVELQHAFPRVSEDTLALIVTHAVKYPNA